MFFEKVLQWDILHLVGTQVDLDDNQAAET